MLQLNTRLYVRGCQSASYAIITYFLALVFGCSRAHETIGALSPSGAKKLVCFEKNGGFATDYIAEVTLMVNGRSRRILTSEHSRIASIDWLNDDSVTIRGWFGMDELSTHTVNGVTISYVNITSEERKSELRERHSRIDKAIKQPG